MRLKSQNNDILSDNWDKSYLSWDLKKSVMRLKSQIMR